MFRNLSEAVSDLACALRALRVQLAAEAEHRRSCAALATKSDLKALELKLLMNASQLETLLNNQATQIGKIAKEQSDRFDALTAANKVLQDLITAGDLSPAIDAAAKNVQAALDNLDASIPDAPVA